MLRCWGLGLQHMNLRRETQFILSWEKDWTPTQVKGSRRGDHPPHLTSTAGRWWKSLSSLLFTSPSAFTTCYHLIQPSPFVVSVPVSLRKIRSKPQSKPRPEGCKWSWRAHPSSLFHKRSLWQMLPQSWDMLCKHHREVTVAWSTRILDSQAFLSRPVMQTNIGLCVRSRRTSDGPRWNYILDSMKTGQ